jgi:hypothetical protein
LHGKQGDPWLNSRYSLGIYIGMAASLHENKGGSWLNSWYLYDAMAPTCMTNKGAQW